jgi:putative aminopeptidase FrvX
MDLASRRGTSPQAAVLGAFESDASHAKASGLAAQTGLLCLPTLNTHGYEIVRRDAISEIAGVVVDFVSGPTAV